MKLVTIIGTRPEIIKMARLIPLLDDNFNHCFIFSGQHYSKNMVDVFFEELEVRKPDVALDIKSSKYEELVPKLTSKVKDLDPDIVLVYGDTNSTLAGALVANKLNKKLIHVEAGLRSFDKIMPEEINRILTDHISEFLFTPTPYTENLLKKERITKNVFVVGNTIVDSVYHYLPKTEKSDVCDRIGLDDYFLLTLHRQELVDKKEIFKGVLDAFSDIENDIIFPIHPRTKKRIKEFGINLPKNITTIPPVGYFDFLKLLKESSVVITDSGGVQEEAVTLRVPCVTVRKNTERMETVNIGASTLTGYNPDKIIESVDNMEKKDLSNIKNPYGDGTASEKIIEKIKSQISS